MAATRKGAGTERLVAAPVQDVPPRGSRHYKSMRVRTDRWQVFGLVDMDLAVRLTSRFPALVGPVL